MISEDYFDGKKKIHMLGIGGIGMCGIAEYLHRKGYEITGSDAVSSQNTRRLANTGVNISYGHAEDNLPEDTELVIYTSAVNPRNHELEKAKRLGIKQIKRAEALGNIVNDKFLIAVSGTHGKTTTASMIAKLLIDNKFDPDVFVGGNLDFLNDGTSRIGHGEYAVVEADEYDRSFHFLKPDIAVITNIESDHLDIYFDIDDIKNSFRKFLECGKKDLKIIACGDDQNIQDVIKKFKSKTTYGLGKKNDYTINEVTQTEKMVSFFLKNTELNIRVFGNYNILNASAAYLAGQELKIRQENFNLSMKTFSGAKRRLELKYENGIRIYDDYAHHPTEVRASLETLKKIFKKRIIVIFQPHLYSRTKEFYKEFGEAFSIADILMLAKIYPAREEMIEGVTSGLILNEFLKSGKEGYYFENSDVLMKELENICGSEDVIVFQGAGDITDMCDRFVIKIKNKTKDIVPL
ncbi:MAG: UDP-N-acetylmuramate--L-alanine ligase [Ignavibacteria bacterium]|nr:UDP-N-acetylmuramate--L-alanine ligase [Ignavibacteria bacterium]